MSRLAFVDVETTGMSWRRDRIIDIGIIVAEQGKILAQFSSLIDPDLGYLSPAITRLTTISSYQLEKAPTFRSIHEQILDLLNGITFVAHNVEFDYRFIKQEFFRLGITFKTRRLCTVKLAREAFPNLPRHNLDYLINYLHLPVFSRHRALSDANSIFHLTNLITRSSISFHA